MLVAQTYALMSSVSAGILNLAANAFSDWANFLQPNFPAIIWVFGI